jgi:pentatricopeptide repeat protein
MMKERGVRPSRYIYATMIHACADAGDVKTLLSYMQEMAAAAIVPSVFSYSCAIRACLKSSTSTNASFATPHKVNELFRSLLSHGLFPHAGIIQAFLTGCRTKSQLNSVLMDMRTWKISPSTGIALALVQTCARLNESLLSIQLLQQLKLPFLWAKCPTIAHLVLNSLINERHEKAAWTVARKMFIYHIPLRCATLCALLRLAPSFSHDERHHFVWQVWLSARRHSICSPIVLRSFLSAWILLGETSSVISLWRFIANRDALSHAKAVSPLLGVHVSDNPQATARFLASLKASDANVQCAFLDALLLCDDLTESLCFLKSLKSDGNMSNGQLAYGVVQVCAHMSEPHHLRHLPAALSLLISTATPLGDAFISSVHTRFVQLARFSNVSAAYRVHEQLLASLRTARRLLGNDGGLSLDGPLAELDGLCRTH